MTQKTNKNPIIEIYSKGPRKIIALTKLMLTILMINGVWTK